MRPLHLLEEQSAASVVMSASSIRRRRAFGSVQLALGFATGGFAAPEAAKVDVGLE
ncbi:hypothetical protein [Nocardia acidivorans]|uniref:hypothetical protein n=1 Tax=Nocardia acidivorans TaxID=404580 RepID=UPI000B0CC0E3|nr:hypothetical protein [Nocardia acidivorans]